MTRRTWFQMALAAFLLGALPLAPAQAEDIGRQMEREFGVVSRATDEGLRFNQQLERVSERITTSVGYKLKSATLLGGRSAKNDDMLNAFALPDGRIYVTLGLMRAVQKSDIADSELAFIVGHEMTHVKEKHGKNQQKKGMTAGILGILVGALGGRTAGDLANLAANAYTSHYSRVDEYRADKGALKAMEAAGYDLDGAPAVLQRLKDKYGDSNKTMTGWFGSHPLTTNRIARAREIITDLRTGQPIPDRTESELKREDSQRK
jgi:predicted Zn-dependent protease